MYASVVRLFWLRRCSYNKERQMGLWWFVMTTYLMFYHDWLWFYDWSRSWCLGWILRRMETITNRHRKRQCNYVCGSDSLGVGQLREQHIEKDGNEYQHTYQLVDLLHTPTIRSNPKRIEKFTEITRQFLISVNINFPYLSDLPYLMGGGLLGKFIFHALHFHWGTDSSKGSEHTVDSRK